jgi:ribosomal protein S18 acetylase RimI-like enzyme
VPAASGGGVRVVPVTAGRWRTYRDVRLAALIDSPRAFWTTYAEAAARTDAQWAEVVAGARVWLALDGDRPVGTVGLFHAEEQPAEEVHLVGMWVASVARGSGVAELLARTAIEHAAAEGRTRVRLEVAVENDRARAFYRRLGFRPTGERSTMPWDPGVVEEAMVRTDLTAG